MARLHAAQAPFAALIDIVNAGIVPLPIALNLFTVKVDSLFAIGRLLWILWPEAENALDAQYEKWARAFLKADP